MEYLLLFLTATIVLSVIIIFVIPPLVFFIKKHCGLHAWEYRNPYDRTCVKCGRKKVAYSRPWSMDRWWWETHNEGNGNIIVCRKPKI